MSVATVTDPAAYPLTDLSLARRLESAEASTGLAFVEARAFLDPGRDAAHVLVGGVVATYDGPESPLTQTFGLGMAAEPTESDLNALESFFSSRGAATQHEVSPFAGAATIALLNARGYRPVELSTVLIRPTAAAPVAPGHMSVRVAGPAESDLWASVAGEGWSSESPELGAFMEMFGRVAARATGVHCFLAELDGRAVAAAALSIAGDVALLAGASTIPAARRRGAQLALLAARLAFAAERDVPLAMMVALPGTASQRNAERQGFRTAYTRTKWRLDAASAR